MQVTPEHWQHVKKMLAATLELEPAKRQAYLDQVCAEPSLRREVESLIAAQEQGNGRFMEHPAVQSGALKNGTKLGPYEILAPLGAGGMGEVYQAHDSKLRRDVAIKVLPAAFVHDPERLSRFQREARMLASLNHQNIATIYGLEQSDGVHYLVMELVLGQTLAERVSAGPLSIAEALVICGQLAEALEAAHEKGVIHRDLKPANVKVAPEGKVKVLDFGLAKAFPSDGGLDLSQSPTLTGMLSEEGRILGTPAYMSPEQARGKPVDKRTDIWAFGCVFYELLTGKRAFRGETVQDTIVAVLEREPEKEALPAATPGRIRDLLWRCLQKDIQRRLRDIGDARIEIEAVTSLASVKSRLWWRRKALGIVAATVLASLIAIAAVRLLSPSEKVIPAQQYIQLTSFADSVSSPALSPDGHMLVFKRGTDTFDGAGQIYVKLLPDGQPVQLTHDELHKMSPVFSPDGSRVAYTVSGRWPWDIWTVPVLGGAPERMLPNASGLTWIDPQHVMFSEITTGIYMKIVTSAESRAEERDVYLPYVPEIGMAHRSYLSPDHKSVLVAEMGNPGWKSCRLVPFDDRSSGREVGPPSARCTNAAWSPDGHWMDFSADTGGGFHLWRQRFPDGVPEQLTFGASQEEGIAVSPDGRSLITAIGTEQKTIWLHDRKGDRQISSEGLAVSPMLSPDGDKIFYLVRSGASQAFVSGELWAAELAKDHAEKVLPGFEISRYDISADGRRMVFAAYDARGKSSLWLASLDRRSPPKQLRSPSEDSRPFFAPDASIVFLRRESPSPSGSTAQSNYIYRMNADGSGQTKVIHDPVIYLLGVSPDGRWIVAWVARQSEESPEAVVAYPADGGLSKVICETCSSTGPAYQGTSIIGWSPDKRFFYLRASWPGMPSRKTYAIPLHGDSLPKLPSSGIRSEGDLLALPGVQTIDQADAFPGRDPLVYTFIRTTTQRNLYRVQLP